MHDPPLAEAFRYDTANDRFKAAWGANLSRATILAVIVHVAVFALWPGWVPPGSPAPPSREITLLQPPAWGFLDEPPAPAGGGPVSPATSVPVEIEGETRASGDVGVLTPATLRERLLGGGAPRPTIMEPEPAVPDPPVVAEAGEDRSPGDGDPSTTGFAGLLDLSDLDLDRLSAIRPQVVHGVASPWALIRNPTEVARYMSRVYARGAVDRGTTGSVSVTVWIDERGSVGWAEINQSSGRSDVDEVALSLFSDVASFRPARNRGVAVPVSMIFWVHFPWF